MSANKCAVSEPIDLRTVDERKIVFDIIFDEFWLGAESEDEEEFDFDEDDENEEYDEEREEEFGWLWGSGHGFIYLFDEPMEYYNISRGDLDDARCKVAGFVFEMSPDDNVRITIKKIYGEFIGLDDIVDDWNGKNEPEFLGSEIDYLTSHPHHESITTLERAYVG